LDTIRNLELKDKTNNLNDKINTIDKLNQRLFLTDRDVKLEADLVLQKNKHSLTLEKENKIREQKLGKMVDNDKEINFNGTMTDIQNKQINKFMIKQQSYKIEMEKRELLTEQKSDSLNKYAEYKFTRYNKSKFG
jgi:hypothetical protein